MQLQNTRGERVVINHGAFRFFSRLSRDFDYRYSNRDYSTEQGSIDIEEKIRYSKKELEA
jgi:hypothetical protein